MDNKKINLKANNLVLNKRIFVKMFLLKSFKFKHKI